MVKISNAYAPQEIELVRGGTAQIRLLVKDQEQNWLDLTNKTVVFRAAYLDRASIRKQISVFAEHESVPCVVEILLSASETRLLSSQKWSWECEYRDGIVEIVFAGGTLVGVGGTNDDD